VCETSPCAAEGATCTVSGYSRYQTFDLEFFEFQGDCEYILTTPCNSDEFNITVQNAAHDQFVSSVNQVQITFVDAKITLKRGDNIAINGVNRTLPIDGVISATNDVQVLRVGGNTHVILLAHNVTIFWDGLYRVEVTVSTTWQNRLCGLCGNYNDDDSDDFVSPDGTQAANADEFGTSWVVSDMTNCSLLDPVRFCPGSVRVEASRLCNLLMRSVFEDCNAVVDSTEFFAACTFDYCNCPPESGDCFCETFASYASACSRAGVIINTWRDSFCRKYYYIL